MVESPQVSLGSQNKPSRVARIYIITTEPWGANIIYEQFTTTTVDEIIKANAAKVPQKANN